MPKRFNWPVCPVLSVDVAQVTVNDFSSGLIAALKSFNCANEPLFITYLNAACSNLAADNLIYTNILQNADCVYADGQSIVWAARIAGHALPERVNAGDFIVTFLKMATAQNLRIGLLGGRPGVAETAAIHWKGIIPGLDIVYAGQGFVEMKDTSVATTIAATAPDILLVGMGAPRQEIWAWANRHQLNTKAVWCVGALFEYYSEERKRAPVFMRRMGMEWMFRLVQEPRRLWRRYLPGNVRFIVRLIKYIYFR